MMHWAHVPRRWWRNVDHGGADGRRRVVVAVRHVGPGSHVATGIGAVVSVVAMACAPRGEEAKGRNGECCDECVLVHGALPFCLPTLG